MKIKVDAAFAGAKKQDGNMIPFGEYYYQTPAVQDNQPYSKVEVNVVFGAMVFPRSTETRFIVSERSDRHTDKLTPS